MPHRAASVSSEITWRDTEIPVRLSRTAASRSSRTGRVRAGRLGQDGQMHRPISIRLGYQGRCRLSHWSAAPITGRWCQPLAMTCSRTDSAAPRSVWRITVA
jgi:hypothetical protein